MSHLLPLFFVSAAISAVPAAGDYFRITVVDQDTGRGVPMVELRTVNNIRFLTDSAGVVAFHEPGLMERRVFFRVSSHGYEFAKDGFAKPTAQMPGKGPTWIDGVVTVRDKDDREQLFAKYVKIKPPMVVYERGLIAFDDERQQFSKRLPRLRADHRPAVQRVARPRR